MTYLVQQLISSAALADPKAAALIHGDRELSYAQLDTAVAATGTALQHLGLRRYERVAVYLDKSPEAVIALFGACAASGAFVPVNPNLKAGQVGYMLADSDARLLVTTRQRLDRLADQLPDCPNLAIVVLVDEPTTDETQGRLVIKGWDRLEGVGPPVPNGTIETDMAGILYTSGSTGRPKGVVLSHRNLVAGAESVTDYLANTRYDRILVALPLSFDYGFSQLTTAFRVGACAVLLNYLLPRDVVRAVSRHLITGLAGVPPLWVQLAELEWPAEAATRLRYVTNSGGSMPRRVLDALRHALPSTDIVLMYGLTEAFRATYLPPAELARRPDAIGIPIPNADVRVLRQDGSECGDDEPGELVQRGPHVTLGYWRAPEKTAERFRPMSDHSPGLPFDEHAVWSGDTVRRDSEGYLYFIARRDEMIKTSGYRVSPEEIEEVVHASGLVGETSAFGVPDTSLGEAIVVVAETPSGGDRPGPEALRQACRRALPPFMVPRHVEIRDMPLPRNANGKIDRQQLRQELEQRGAQANE